MINRSATGLAIGLAVAVLAGANAVHASEADALKSSMVGQWELSTTDRNRTCVLTLSAEGPASAMKLALEPDCAKALPFTADIAGWSVKGLDIVRLQDGAGHPVIDLSEVESGILEGVRQGEGVYILQNLESAREATRSIDYMIGNWVMERGSGSPVCGLTLTNTESGSDTFAVFLKPRCDLAVANFAPKYWKLERGDLQLISEHGEAWHFQADDNAQWRRVPEGAEPLILVRQ